MYATIQPAFDIFHGRDDQFWNIKGTERMLLVALCLFQNFGLSVAQLLNTWSWRNALKSWHLIHVNVESMFAVESAMSTVLSAGLRSEMNSAWFYWSGESMLNCMHGLFKRLNDISSNNKISNQKQFLTKRILLFLFFRVSLHCWSRNLIYDVRNFLYTISSSVVFIRLTSVVVTQKRMSRILKICPNLPSRLISIYFCSKTSVVRLINNN